MHAGVHGPSKRADIYAHMLTIYHALRTGWPACGFFLFCYLLRRGVLNIGHGQPRSYDATRIGLCEIGAYLECRGRGWEEEEKSLFKADAVNEEDPEREEKEREKREEGGRERGREGGRERETERESERALY